MTRALLVLAWLTPSLMAACGLLPPVPPAPPGPLKAEEACAAFCELQVALKCDDTPDSPGPDELDGTADDVTCTQVCEDTVREGAYTPDRPCLDRAETCETSEVCILGPETAALPQRRGVPQLGGSPQLASLQPGGATNGGSYRAARALDGGPH